MRAIIAKISRRNIGVCAKIKNVRRIRPEIAINVDIPGVIVGVGGTGVKVIVAVGTGVKVEVGITVSVGMAVIAGAQETRTKKRRKTVRSFLIFIDTFYAKELTNKVFFGTQTY